VTLLFTPIVLRGVTVRNRVAISPMQQYSAVDGVANDWHLIHLARFALGGAGIVFVGASAVEKRGRNTHGDLGLWSDDQVEPLARIARTLRAQGAVAGVQLGHTGRKGALQKWWEGHGPLGEADRLERDEGPWPVVAPSALAAGDGYPVPHALSTAEVEELVRSYGQAARRAREAGFEVLEVHGAHGYLIHQFMSPVANRRDDRYGGSRDARFRFAYEVAQAVRAEWPESLPLFWRVSLGDEDLGADDMVVFARGLAARGIDVIDCSSGGGISSYPASGKQVPRGIAFLPGLGARIREEAGIGVMAVGLIIDPHEAEDFLAAGQADLIAIGREALFNPNWAVHAEIALGANRDYETWPRQYRWWLAKRAPLADAVRAAGKTKQ
jgi:2,4-dienoyl-CoA reductase-like NADH-dependent reductase (Old Yellow Enzyme family)